jgi:hypothetical protein
MSRDSEFGALPGFASSIWVPERRRRDSKTMHICARGLNPWSRAAWDLMSCEVTPEISDAENWSMVARPNRLPCRRVSVM